MTRRTRFFAPHLATPKGSLRRRGEGGFTLLEVILVLLIIALLAGASLVDFGEFHQYQVLKETASDLKRLARTASRSSAAWGVDYRLRIEPKQFFLVTAGEPPPGSVRQWDGTIRLELRTRGESRWRVPEAFEWVFPGSGVAEPLAVRMTGRNGAFVEMSFNPLTGAVDEEIAYFP